MKVIICPGIHSPELTESFVSSVSALPIETSNGSRGSVGAQAVEARVGVRRKRGVQAFEETSKDSPSGMSTKRGLRPAGADREGNKAYPNSIATNPDIQWLVFPTDKHPPYSPLAVYDWLNKPEILTDKLLFIAFSAGVVGGIGAAIALEEKGVNIKAFIAIDGWGVPLWGNFPLYRFSHDYFTHWSSAILGTGKESFYADPSVEHLAMWRSPETCQGWIVSNSSASKINCSAKDYLQQIIDY
ncbi:MAG: hypothetical protein QNJ65_16130 [Xenococcaceae cyanobacterium MO_234.B1]|nr:hypothetical protein [Xenococcaceae cyanobacterium MO_234.B1]